MILALSASSINLAAAVSRPERTKWLPGTHKPTYDERRRYKSRFGNAKLPFRAGAGTTPVDKAPRVQHADIANVYGPQNVALTAYAYQGALPLLLATTVTQGFGHRTGGVGAEAVALGDLRDTIRHCCLLMRRGLGTLVGVVRHLVPGRFSILCVVVRNPVRRGCRTLSELSHQIPMRLGC